MWTDSDQQVMRSTSFGRTSLKIFFLICLSVTSELKQ